MDEIFTLDDQHESYVKAQLASGRFKSVSEVLQAALDLMEQRDYQLQALDSSIHIGLDDIANGKLHSSDAVFDELDARYELMAIERSEQ